MSDTLKIGAIKLFAIRLTGKILAFLLYVLLARIMTLNNYGELMYLLSLIAIFTVISPLGLDILVLRYINTFAHQKKFGLVKGMYIFSSSISFVTASVFFILLMMTLTLSEKIQPLSHEVILSIYLIMTLSSYMAIRRNFLLSIKKALAAELPEAVIRPALVILLIFTLLYFQKINITKSQILIIIAASWLIITIGSKFWLNHITKNIFTKNPIYKKYPWFIAGLPIMVVTLGFTSMAEVDVILLANIGSVEDSAVYSVATRFIQVFALPLGVLQSISASSLALFHQKNEAKNYSLLASKLSKFSFLIAIPILLIILLFSDTLLSLFGEDYKQGSFVLIILALTATVNAWFGATGYSLAMTGNQKFLAKLILLALFVNISLDILLIPMMGINGAALATLVSILGWNFIAMLYIKSKLGYLIVWIPLRNQRKLH